MLKRRLAIRLKSTENFLVRLLVILSHWKSIGGLTIYGHLLMPLLGVIGLFRGRITPILLLPFIAIFINAMGFLLRHELNAESLARLVQLTGCVGFCHFIAQDKSILSQRWEYVLLFLITATALLGELFVVGPDQFRNVLGRSVPRLSGTQEGVNFLAATVGFLSLLCVARRYYILAFLFVLCGVPTLSRGGLLAFLFALPFVIAPQIRWNIKHLNPSLVRKTFTYATVSVLLLYPVALLAMDLNHSLVERIDDLSTHRFNFHIAYAKIGSAHPLAGVGYFQGVESVEFVVDDSLAFRKFNEAHSIYLQVWSEFGIVSYLLFSCMITYSCRRSLATRSKDLGCLIFALISFMFLNGLSAWAFWLAIGIAIRGPEHNDT
ncbi:O-antigen ligase family protein [Rhodopirellula bahusiensis]|uniref:O-antigen ligase-related domain-containing protein n=1 Tax=Rhodopirellula bahusiensis TaxID=2014065 RepID=A0A2G1W633_9BACT|nr:O-antigen ligase family protein [Rhodopirellula bahusiensis]PHQ34280.1 hypothetical protein CEE69_16775 [Rhodopirellula bahusiensis]